MTRAVLEGVAFGLKDGLELMLAAGIERPGQIRVSGGGTKSPLWRQILADVLQAEIAIVTTEEGAAYGAALLAGVGAGWFDSVEEAAQEVIRVEPAEGPSDAVELYAEAHEAYRDLYPALRPTFRRLAT
jgi:xylulokinase